MKLKKIFAWIILILLTVATLTAITIGGGWMALGIVGGLVVLAGILIWVIIILID